MADPARVAAAQPRPGQGRRAVLGEAGGQWPVSGNPLHSRPSRAITARRLGLCENGPADADGQARLCGGRDVAARLRQFRRAAGFLWTFTQQAAFAALDFLRRETFVKPGKVALFGYSRGAIVAAMVATQDSALATVVLGAGAYDFFAWHPTIPGIARNIAEEAGTSPEAYLARSALYHAQTIKAPSAAVARRR